MGSDRPLPIHESSQRLRELYPECPRVYGVAVMSDLSRRRWWPLTDALGHRPDAGDVRGGRRRDGQPVAVAQQLAATFAHVVIGRVVPLLVLEGRAWDTGLENLWVHVDSEGAIDWVGVVDPTLRALPDDAHSGGRGRAGRRRPHRRAPQRGRPGRRGWPIAATARSSRCSPGWRGQPRRDFFAAMWHVVGTAVVSAATQVPLLAGSSELTSMRRGQAVLDALVGFGAPVRGGRRAVTARPC